MNAALGDTGRKTIKGLMRGMPNHRSNAFGWSQTMHTDQEPSARPPRDRAPLGTRLTMVFGAMVVTASAGLRS